MAATFSRWKSRLPPPLRSRPHCEVSTSRTSARLRESRRLHCCSAAFVASSYRQLRHVSHARDPAVVTLQAWTQHKPIHPRRTRRRSHCLPWSPCVPCSTTAPPGWLATKPCRLATAHLRRFLAKSGFTVYYWEGGVNTGPAGVLDDWLGDLEQRVRKLHRGHGRKASLIGWSLGGVYAREIAKRCPECVRQVITLGTPF